MPAGIAWAGSPHPAPLVAGELAAFVENEPLNSSATVNDPSLCGDTTKVTLYVSFAQLSPQKFESPPLALYGPNTSGELTPEAPLSPFGPAAPVSPFGPAGPCGPADPVSPFG